MMARYFETNESGFIRCTLCPHACGLTDGKTGICGVRTNRNGDLELPYAGRVSAMALDPIEKKPLYHFHPGKRILSVGFVGCSFHCPFCQNYSISQGTLAATRPYTSEDLVEAARERDSFALAYTYSEPTNHFEFISETAALARSRGLRNVLVSNGYLNRKPAEELCSLMDAANIDLKSFNDDFYRKELGGKLKPVLEFLEIAAGKTHLEVTTLVIPGKNDSPGEIEEIAKFVASLGDEIPLHLSAYYPTYKYDVDPTLPSTLAGLAELCRKHLAYVYLGNVRGGSDTACRKCGTTLIRRDGYTVRVDGLSDGRCSRCGTEIPVVGV